VPGERAAGIKNVTFNEPISGHFPGDRSCLGADCKGGHVGGIVLINAGGGRRTVFVFAGIDKVRFRRQVVPGDQLVTERCGSAASFGKMYCAEVDGQRLLMAN